MSVFDSFLSFFADRNDPEAEKKRQLRAIAKNISRCKYKFYNPHSGQALPGFAKFIFEMYKTVSSAQVLLQNAASSKVLREVIIDLFFTDRQREAATRLTEESINERAATVSKQILAEVKNDISIMTSDFSIEATQNIDKTYSLLISLANFASFNFFFMLKKFDSNISERNFNATPSFEVIRADYILEDLQEFLTVAYALPLTENWSNVFAAVKRIKGVDLVNVRQWNKMINLLREVKKTDILTLILRHLSKNPMEKIIVNSVSEHIVDEYLQKQRTTAELVLHKIQTEERNSKIGDYAMQVFGTKTVLRLKNYTEKANEAFAKRMVGGFTHVDELNYVKAFLLDYYKRDVRELIDLFLIKGQWTTTIVSGSLSESFYALMDLSDTVSAFDDDLATDGIVGQRLKGIMGKMDRDKEQANFLRNLLKDVNEKANGYIMTATKNLIIIAKIFKQLLEDYDRTNKELLTNWASVIKITDIDIKATIPVVYKKIYNFVMLLQSFQKKD